MPGGHPCRRCGTMLRQPTTADPVALHQQPSLWLELTPRCNLSCQFCYNPWRSEDKSKHPVGISYEVLTKQVSRLLDRAEFRYVALSGGEPLLYPHLPALTSWLSARQQRAILTTNGRLLTGTRIESLQTAGLAGVQVSLLGAKSATHDALAGRASWRQALHAIADARAAGMSTAVTFIATEANLHELLNVVKLVASLGVVHLVVNELQPVGSARANLDHLDVSSRCFQDMVRQATRLADGLGVSINVIRSRASSEDRASGLWRRWSISPDGHLKLCNHSTDTLGALQQLTDERLDAIVEHLASGDLEQLVGTVNNCGCFDRALRQRVRIRSSSMADALQS
jgi:MoaA/NifB/PqqE/SkfB family radical SAM enzyme